MAETDVKDVVEMKNDDTPKKEKSFFSRIWDGLISLHGDDLEKRLHYISREEATILARQKKRSSRWRKTARNIIVSSVLLEVVAIGYAIATTRTVNLEWQMRAVRVLPLFLLPALSWALYSGLQTLTGVCDCRDQRKLEKLRAERKAKIDELKERTNYYNTQQLIQRYDPDPAAKAAAASVLASKLGADSGLNVFVDEAHLSQYGIGTSSDVELVQSTGLRRRNQNQYQSEARSPGTGSLMSHSDKEYASSEVSEISLASELVVEHHNSVPIAPQEGGWIARLAALLVGEDPTQSYALICGNCHMHNGLARKEDFLVFTYYCPHCNALNKPHDNSSPNTSPNMRSSTIHNYSPSKHHENSLDPNVPDLNKPLNSLDDNTREMISPNSNNAPDMRSLNKPRNLEDKTSDAPDVISSANGVVNSNLLRQKSDSISAKTIPVEESEKKVTEDPPAQ